MGELVCDVLIVGGGTGGTAAALAASSLGLSVILTEETDWIGGQLTSQAVPPDEHPWIEQFGCTRRYRTYRDKVREYYRTHLPLTALSKSNPNLNPGGGYVSKLCHEPKIGWEVLSAMAASVGTLDIRLHTVACGGAVLQETPIETGADRPVMHGDRVISVPIMNIQTGAVDWVKAKYFIDATELGDLLPLTDTEYIVGAESRAETQEPNGVEGPLQPDNVQGITWCFAMGFDPHNDHTIPMPDQYEKWASLQPSFWPGRLLGPVDIHPWTNEPRIIPFFDNSGKDFFTYRKIVEPTRFEPGAVPHAVTIVNWPMNDYFEASTLEIDQKTLSSRLADAKQLSLSLLYYLQVEQGHKGFYLRPDITGTSDGFAKTPYIREARRIKSRFTVLEQHVAAESNPDQDRAVEFEDSVGVGAYRIDLHPSTNGVAYIDTSSLPFQIPLGSLVPVRTRNLIPACKNLGVTHITNGCYRLHPVEWNLGESAGLLAAFCIQKGVEPAQVLEQSALLGSFQSLLRAQDVEIEWPKLRAL